MSKAGMRVPDQGGRAAAEARLVELRAKLREALADKKARMREFVESCKADRRAIREQVQGMRARSTRDLRDQVQAARGAAKLTRLTRLAEVRQVTSSAVERARALAAVERQHQTELARIAQTERSRRVEIRLAHERALEAGDLRSAVFGKLSALFQHESRSVRAAPGESRAEALLRFAERNAEKAHKAIEPQVHRRVEETKRAVVEAERSVRGAGGSIRSAPARTPLAPKLPMSGDGPSPRANPPAASGEVESTAKSPAVSPTPAPPTKEAAAARSPAPAVAAPRSRAKKSPPKKVPKRHPAKQATGRAALPTKAAPPRRPPKPPTRRLGQIPPGGMPLKDFLAENAHLAAKKAARGRGRPGAKVPAAPAAPAPLPPAASPANSNTPAIPPPSTGQRSLFTSEIAQSVKPYKVRASCGHIVIRPMREATAGVPYSPDVVLDALRGRACDECEAKKDYAANAPKPTPKKEVRAPELKDTAEIAKRIRADIADAVRKKELARGSYSVRTSKYSLGSEINVVASKLPFAMLNPAAFRLERGSSHMAFDRDHFHTRYTPQAERVLVKLAAIVDAYHWDRSDQTTDYHHSRFGRDVRLDDEAEWERINAEKVAAARSSPAGTSP